MKVSLKLLGIVGMLGLILFSSEKKVHSTILGSEKSPGHELELIHTFIQKKANKGFYNFHKVAETILVESKKHQIDPLLVVAIIYTESSFRPSIISRVGAVGLMQVLPSTAKSMLRHAHINYKKYLLDPVKNIEIGLQYLNHLIKRFNGDSHLFLTAYNAGPTRVSILKKNRSKLLKQYGYAKKVLKEYTSLQTLRVLNQIPSEI